MPKTLTCDPALFTKDLSGTTYVVTGANSGIGLVTAEQLAKQGATVVVACRRPDAAEEAIADIRSRVPGAKLEFIQLDLGSLDSVRAFAASFLERHEQLHGLVNNAGVMNTPQGTTKDGFETQLGINHLGHFLLTDLLLDRLKESAPSRVVILSSCFHDQANGRDGDIHFDDLQLTSGAYDGWTAYAQSKLANLLHAKGLAKRLEGTGVTAVSVHPGWVRTNLIKNTAPVWVQDYLMRPISGLIGMIEPWEGAQTTLHCLLADDVPQNPGAYYSQKGVYRSKEAKKGGWPLRSPNPNAHDDAKAEKLWTVSRELTGAATA